MTDSVKEKLIEAAQVTEKQVEASRGIFDGSNANLANKTNVKSAFNNKDANDVVNLGAGSDTFHFGGWARGSEFTVDMGNERLGDDAYGADVHVRNGFKGDNDTVTLKKSIDDYTFELNDDKLVVTDNLSDQTINFLNVEKFRVDGMTVRGEDAADLFNKLMDLQDAVDESDPGNDGIDMTLKPNKLNLQLAHQIVETGTPGDYLDLDNGVVVTGDLNDRFHFGGHDVNSDVDLTVDMGSGVDTVSLSKSINNYKIEVGKSDGGDSVTYDSIAFTDIETGQKVTFSGADRFVFHNNVENVNYTDDVFDFADLVEATDVVEDAIMVMDQVELAYEEFGVFAPMVVDFMFPNHEQDDAINHLQITEVDIA